MFHVAISTKNEIINKIVAMNCNNVARIYENLKFIVKGAEIVTLEIKYK